MILLLDTHTLIWFAEGSQALSSRAKNAIEDREISSLYSIASIWEIAIKLRLGKPGVSRRLDSSFEELLEAYGLNSLPITFSHVCRVARLSLHRRGPFDRLLAAQALEEKLTVVSRDASFDAYNVT